MLRIHCSEVTGDGRVIGRFLGDHMAVARRCLDKAVSVQTLHHNEQNMLPRNEIQREIKLKLTRSVQTRH